jgi:hypothetical protein
MTASPHPQTWLDDLIVGLTYWYFTSLVVLLAVLLGHDFVKPPPWKQTKEESFLDCFCRHDGQNYRRIVVEGYAYDPERRSMVAFFPVYPLLARGIVETTGCAPELALLIVSNACLAGAFVVLHRYVRLRYGRELGALTQPRSPGSVGCVGPSVHKDPPGKTADAPYSALPEYALLAFGVFPTTFFFRMAYTEAPFLLLLLLVLLGVQQRWSLYAIAVIVGLATATRPVGIALVPVFALHVWQRSASWRVFLLEATALLPLSCWGLLAYMAFQYGAFDDPLAFAHTQEHWRFPVQEASLSKPWSLLTLEPIWGLFTPSSPRYWERFERHGNPIFSMMVANPIYLMLTIVLIVVGRMRRWLDNMDVVLAAGLILIPYITRGYEMSMASFGRFIAVVPALYLVLAQLAMRSPLALRHGLLVLAVLFLAGYAMLFAAGYLVF